MKKRKSISVWIEEKTWCGQFTFSHDDLITAFPEMSAGAIARALTREVANGRIVSPVRGFYVVVPEEYRLRGTVHQSFYIDNLMRHLGRTYYVSLLSAAEIHGAAHQAPMTYYVIIEPPAMRDKKTDRYETHFVCKIHIPTAFVEQRQTRTGYINVSCPELTAVDLISYQDRLGGITRASTILAELADMTDYGRMGTEFVDAVPVSSLQRLGYILDVILDNQRVASSLYDLLVRSGVHLQAIPLKVGKSTAGYTKNEKWKVIANMEIEIDDL